MLTCKTMRSHRVVKTNVKQTSIYSAKPSRVRAPQRLAAVQTQTQQFEKFPLWDAVFYYLMQKNLATVSPEQAQQMVATDDWVFVDVRPPGVYEKAHIQGAVSVPLFQPVDWSKANAKTVLRSVAFLFNGVTPVEMNPRFKEDMASIANSGKGIITYCEAGGTLKPNSNFPTGKASRSLQAAYRILVEGITSKVVHLEGGAYKWYQSDLPFDGEYDTENVGRTPNAAE